MSNTFPRWKYYLLLTVLCVGFIYAIPNLYGEDPAVQISGLKENPVTQENVDALTTALAAKGLQPKSANIEEERILLRFANTETQLKANDVIKETLGKDYSVALNLAPVTPKWLQTLGAKPMKLGLDLRGGVHFLMAVDVDSVLVRHLDSYYTETPKLLREANVPFKKLDKISSSQFVISFNNEADLKKAKSVLEKHQQDMFFTQNEELGQNKLEASLTPQIIQTIRNETLEQTASTMRNRVNELGVAEAVVQRQGLNHIVVELPGIQDTSYAKDILGKTATLKFLMEDSKHDIKEVLKGHPVIGSKIYYDREGRPALLKTQAVLTGEQISGATTGQDRDGRPAVNIRIGGDTSAFSKMTAENIGQRMAVLYIEVKDNVTTETVVSLATIQGALGNSFQITGLNSYEARDLSLLLRAGALPATLSIAEESIVGPSMGQENIRMGMISVTVGLALVLIFMGIYYSIFGLIANLALLANLILLLAVMSLIGATLTMPGIAGIVLTLGMAVDANVLIFERIREELRLGLSPQASVHRGYEYAFATIIDSNLTTLIVGVVLFTMGSGPVKGFAVTLCIGILTSLLTATTGSRALVNLLYGRRTLKHVPVGI